MGTDMPGNLVVIKSMAKFFSLPGVRLGMLAAAPMLYADLEFIRESRKTRPAHSHDIIRPTGIHSRTRLHPRGE